MYNRFLLISLFTLSIAACSDIKVPQHMVPIAVTDNALTSSQVDYYHAAMATEKVEDLLILVNRLNSLNASAIDNNLVVKLLAKHQKMSDKEQIIMLRLLNGKVNYLHLDSLKPMLLSKNNSVAEEAYLLLLGLPLNRTTRSLHSLVMLKTNSSFIKSKAKSLLTS